MKLPNADLVVVEQEKIAGYLLNLRHPVGVAKARFFNSFGFHSDRWEQLAEALKVHARMHEVARARETGFGLRYEVEGELLAVDGRTPRVCSVWQLDHGTVAPRIITVYPD